MALPRSPVIYNTQTSLFFNVINIFGFFYHSLSLYYKNILFFIFKKRHSGMGAEASSSDSYQDADDKKGVGSVDF